MLRNAIIASVFCVAALHASDRFVQDEGHFSVQFPESVTAEKSGECAVANNAAQDYHIEIEPNKVPGGMTVHNVAQLNEKMNAASLKDYKKIKSGSMATAINAVIPWSTMSFTEGKRALMKTAYLIYNAADRRLITVTCVTTVETHETRRAEFEQLVRSLGFK